MNLRQDTKPEHAFYCADGRVLKNLTELAEELKGISPEAYRHHANESRNDFHNWIRDVYGNKKLAKEVAFAGSSKEAARIIEKAISPPQKKPAKKKRVAAAKRKPARRRRKPAKKTKKAAAVVVAKKKEKRKSAEKTRKRRKTKRKPARRKIMLHRKIHKHIKMIARKWGLL